MTEQQALPFAESMTTHPKPTTQPKPTKKARFGQKSMALSHYVRRNITIGARAFEHDLADWRLDEHTCTVGRAGIAKARQTLLAQDGRAPKPRAA